MPIPAGLPDRRKKQLIEKGVALKSATLASWLKESRQGGVFQIHNSQMNAIEELIGVLSEDITERCDGATPSTISKVEQEILAVFQTWEFFRSKLAQRLEPGIQPFLRICDELAWKCYEPFRMAAGLKPWTKEPPLVFLGSDVSPFVKERNRASEPGYAPGAIAAKIGFEETLKIMPFPVIGVPWYQRDYLPDALVICHEAGHAIESDFGLAAGLDRLLEGAVPEERAGFWKAWRREVFADTIACLAAGPAFVWTLADFLFAERSRVVGIQNSYPSHYLRILYGVEVLRAQAGPAPSLIGAEADAIETWWRNEFGGRHPLAAYEGDLTGVAAALLNGRFPVFGEKPLREILKFTEFDQKAAEKVGSNALTKDALSAVNIRTGVAAARIAFSKDTDAYYTPVGKDKPTPQKLILDHLLKTACRNDLRGRSSDEQDKLRLAHIRQTGQALASRMRSQETDSEGP